MLPKTGNTFIQTTKPELPKINFLKFAYPQKSAFVHD